MTDQELVHLEIDITPSTIERWSPKSGLFNSIVKYSRLEVVQM